MRTSAETAYRRPALQQSSCAPLRNRALSAGAWLRKNSRDARIFLRSPGAACSRAGGCCTACARGAAQPCAALHSCPLAFFPDGPWPRRLRAHSKCVRVQPASAETFHDVLDLPQHIVDTIGALHPTTQRAPPRQPGLTKCTVLCGNVALHNRAPGSTGDGAAPPGSRLCLSIRAASMRCPCCPRNALCPCVTWSCTCAAAATTAPATTAPAATTSPAPSVTPAATTRPAPTPTPTAVSFPPIPNALANSAQPVVLQARKSRGQHSSKIGSEVLLSSLACVP